MSVFEVILMCAVIILIVMVARLRSRLSGSSRGVATRRRHRLSQVSNDVSSYLRPMKSAQVAKHYKDAADVFEGKANTRTKEAGVSFDQKVDRYDNYTESSLRYKQDQEQDEPVDSEDNVIDTKDNMHDPLFTSTSEVVEPIVITLYLKAKDGRPYGGYELLQAILAAGFRYGEMNIFHCYEKKTVRGPVRFSLASAVAPGTFDLSSMGGFSTPALTLFFRTSNDDDPINVFEQMLHTAEQLIDDLGGVVLDDMQEKLTQEKVREICLQLKANQANQAAVDLFG